MCGFIAQLVEHRTGIAEVTGSNPVEALIISGFFFSIAFSWSGPRFWSWRRKWVVSFDVGWQCLNKKFQVIINKFRDAFSKVTIACLI